MYKQKADSNKRIEDIPVQNLMTRNLITVRSDEVVTTISKIFQKHNFHHIPVVNAQECLVGIVSLTDFERIKSGVTLFRNPKVEEFNEAIFQTLQAKEIMTKGVTHLRPMDSVQIAYKVFKRNKFRALPVIEKGKLVGILTPLDILDYFFQSN